MSDCNMDNLAAILAAGREFDPSEVVLIGAKLGPDDEATEGTIKVNSDLVTQLTLSCTPKTDGGAGEPNVAVVYAYAYEGHTYRLPKPRIVIVEGDGEAYINSTASNAVGEADGTAKLYLWRMSKHTKTVAIEIETGTVESLILDANTPGNQSTKSYASNMQLSHRGGRLS
ncbi:hypothetical protein [Amaricoccus tamworthensis]|uniref:hypothetical protein n=1 Tax=Amaricoccus tamworthensis TaxID=57002 RepID=UPI003C7B747A